MKQPVVDYRAFRLSRLNEPRFSHLKWLGGWLLYFALYLLTENLIPAERCMPVYCFLDDLIPFCEAFIVPYVGWYALIVFCLVYFALYDIGSFTNLSKYIFTTQMVAMAIYILFPTRQDLRPEVFARENIFTEIIGWLYAFDTNTGVCPSLHAAYSLGIASVWLRKQDARKATKAMIVLAVVLICLSTMFVKQHSALDVLAAILLGLVAEWVVFYRKKHKAAEPEGVSQ